MLRRCPNCNANLNFILVLKEGFTGNPVICHKCKLQISKPLSNYAGFGVAGFVIGLIIFNLIGIFDWSFLGNQFLFYTLVTVVLLLSGSLAFYFMVPLEKEWKSFSMQKNAEVLESNKEWRSPKYVVLAKYSDFIIIPFIVVFVILFGVIGILLGKYGALWLLFLGFLVVLFGVRKIKLFLSLKNYKSAYGEIISELVGEKLEASEVERKIKYYPRVLYKYNVDGVEYISDRVSFDFKKIAYNSKDDVLHFLKESKSGDHLSVFYNQKNHSLSTLISEYSQGLVSNYLAVVLGGGIIIAIGVVTFYIS